MTGARRSKSNATCAYSCGGVQISMLFEILVLPVYLIHTLFVARGRALHGIFMREMTCACNSNYTHTHSNYTHTHTQTMQARD